MRTTTTFGTASPAVLHRARRSDVDWRPRTLLPEGDDHGAGGGDAAAAAAKAAADKAAADAKTAADKAAADAKAAADKATADRGYPENTPVDDMTAEQAAAYWKHHARKHEERVRALGVTPEQLEELKTKAKRADDLDYELASDKEKAVADAKREAEKITRDAFVPKLVRAEFRAAVGGRLTAEQLETALDPLDLSKFLTSNGDVDTDKVTAHAAIIAPDKGNNGQQRGPAAGSGQGTHGSSGSAPKGSVAAGAELYERLHPKKAS